MLSVPQPASPGCILVIGAFLLGFVGLLFAVGGVRMWIDDGSWADGALFFGIGSLAVIISSVMLRSGLTGSESPQPLFLTPTPYSPGTHKKKEERELADKYLEESYQNAKQLTQKDQQILERVKTNPLNTITDDDVAQVLNAKSTNGIILKNSLLQPIAFAIRPTTSSNYIKGVVLEALTWGGVITIGSVLVLFSPVLLLLFIWGYFRTLLHYVLRWSRRARQYRVRPHNVFLHDRRAPILYLRSFSDDLNEDAESLLPTTAEEKLVRSYNRHGPVIAIGNPMENLPLLGASRIYFDDATWPAGVRHLISVSHLVIIQAGIAPGLLAELSVIRGKLDPEKVLISFTGWEDLDESTRHRHYLRFKKYAEVLLECELPSDIQNTSHLIFDEDWRVKPQSGFAYSLPSVRERRRKILGFVGAVSAVAVVITAMFLLPLVQQRFLDLTGLNTEETPKPHEDPPSYKEDPAKWKEHTLELTGMTIDLPANPTPVEVPVRLGLEQKAFKCTNLDLNAFMGHLFTNPDSLIKLQFVNEELWLRDLAKFQLNLISETSNDTFTTRAAGKGVFDLEGKFMKDGKQYETRCKSSVKHHDLWFICTSHSSVNNAAGEAAKRILQSVKITAEKRAEAKNLP